MWGRGDPQVLTLPDSEDELPTDVSAAPTLLPNASFVVRRQRAAQGATALTEALTTPLTVYVEYEELTFRQRVVLMLTCPATSSPTTCALRAEDCPGLPPFPPLCPCECCNW